MTNLAFINNKSQHYFLPNLHTSYKRSHPITGKLHKLGIVIRYCKTD